MNTIKKIKYLLHKIKSDLESLNTYPGIDLSSGFKIDYDKYWKKRRGEDYKSSLSGWQKERADYALKFLKDGDIVVDIGGGDGEVLKYIKSKVSIKGICADFDELVLAEAKKNGLETINIDLSDLNNAVKIPDCDYILGFEILEHMPNPEEFIMAVKSRVRISMIFSFPNTGYYTHRLRLFFGKFPLQWVSHPGEHLRFWAVSDVQWWIKNMGLHLDEIRLYQGMPFLNKILPKLFGQGIIVKIKK